MRYWQVSAGVFPAPFCYPSHFSPSAPMKRLPQWIEVLGLIFALVGVFLISTHGNIHSMVILLAVPGLKAQRKAEQA